MSSVSVEGHLLASGSHDKKVQVWDMQTNRKRAEFQHEDKVWCVQLTNKFLISSSSDKSVKIWDLETEKVLYKLTHSRECYNFDLDRDKTVLAVASNTAVVIWDFKKGTKIKEYNPGNWIHDVRFNPAGDTLVAGLHDGRVFKISLQFGSTNELETS